MMNAWLKRREKKGQIEGILFNLSVWLRIKIQVYSVLQPNLFSCMRRGREVECMVEGKFRSISLHPLIKNWDM